MTSSEQRPISHFSWQSCSVPGTEKGVADLWTGSLEVPDTMLDHMTVDLPPKLPLDSIRKGEGGVGLSEGEWRGERAAGEDARARVGTSFQYSRAIREARAAVLAGKLASYMGDLPLIHQLRVVLAHLSIKMNGGACILLRGGSCLMPLPPALHWLPPAMLWHGIWHHIPLP